MKKLISLFASTGLVATSSATVVACVENESFAKWIEFHIQNKDKDIKELKFESFFLIAQAEERKLKWEDFHFSQTHEYLLNEFYNSMREAMVSAKINELCDSIVKFAPTMTKVWKNDKKYFELTSKSYVLEYIIYQKTAPTEPPPPPQDNK